MYSLTIKKGKFVDLHIMMVHKGVEVECDSFLTLARDRGEW